MNDIRHALRIAARRLELNAFLHRLHQVAIWVAGIALLLMLAERIGPSLFVMWVVAAPVLAAVALVIALVIWSRRRRTEHQVAVVVDERLDLREKFSTALHCRDRDDAFAQAALHDAVSAARDPRVRESVRRRFRVEAPGRWWVSPLIIVAAVGLLMAPPFNLFARAEQERQRKGPTPATRQSERFQQLVQGLRAVRGLLPEGRPGNE